MKRLFRHAVYFLWISGAIGVSQKTASQEHISGSRTSSDKIDLPATSSTASPGTPDNSQTAGNATCPNRTVNYITHGLPQQCLKTDRASYNATITASVHSTVDVTRVTQASTVLDLIAADVFHNNELGTQVAALAATSTLGDPSAIGAISSTAPEAKASGFESDLSLAAEDESESPLDTANFLSFEEWKKQNLAKLGQSAEDIGRGQPINPNRPHPGINNALDTLGEENEIELDFSGFGGAAASSLRHAHSQQHTSEAGQSTSEQPGSPAIRSKDAGKTCKERTNYASFDCSATVLKSNKECKSASSILVENKDSYALNKCSAKNKFIIVQLCNDIQIDTVVLANYEFFSASFRHFRISVSDRYPVEMEKWRELGTFEARNTREIQAFLIENPLIWAKYLRVEFLTHYGTEYYCPVTLLRVHGTTMIEDYRHEEDLARGEQAQVTLEAEAVATPAVAQEPLRSTDEVEQATVQAIPAMEKSTLVSEVEEYPQSTLESSAAVMEEPSKRSENATASAVDISNKFKQVGVLEPPNINMTCESPSALGTKANLAVSPTHTRAPLGTSTEAITPTPETSKTKAAANDSGDVSNTTSVAEPAVPVDASASSAVKPSLDSSHKNSGQGTGPNATSIAASATNSSSSTLHESAGNQSSPSVNATRNIIATSTSSSTPQPSTQESFFKSFHKRLQQLESNSTLSLKYIEEQSRILRDAFSKVEKRQVSSTTRFLSQLNETVMVELQGLRQAYDQLWQGTVIELEGQQDTYQREMLALSSRLTMIADELVWQKRLGIVQSSLLLLCLAMALFGRSENGIPELPLMQQVMNRSTAAFRGGWESPPNSPSPDSRSPASIIRKKIWRSRTEPAGEVVHLTESENSRPQSKEGPDVRVDPPSPPHGRLSSDLDEPYEFDSSPNAAGKDNMTESSTSPKRNRKRPKKPLSLPHMGGLNGRAKSPLAM